MVNSDVELFTQLGVVLWWKIAISANVRSSFDLLFRVIQSLAEQKCYYVSSRSRRCFEDNISVR